MLGVIILTILPTSIMVVGVFIFVQSGTKITPTEKALRDSWISWERGLRSSSVLIELTTTDHIIPIRQMASRANVDGQQQ